MSSKTATYDRKTRLYLVSVLLVFTFAQVSQAMAEDIQQKTLVYQGRLANGDGDPIGAQQSQLLQMSFGFFPIPEPGAIEPICSWTQSEVNVTDGLFQVEIGNIGEGTGTCDDMQALLSNTGEMWMEIGIWDAELEAYLYLSPRLRVGATARAHHCQNCEHAMVAEELDEELQPVCYSGSYLDLMDLDISQFVTLENLSPLAESGSYQDLVNKPSLFPPSTHSHLISEVSGLQGVLNQKSDDGHAHPISEVAGLQGALGQKSDIEHTHVVTSAQIQNGTIIASDINEQSVQRRITGTCPEGKAVSGIGSTGTVSCTASSQKAYALATTTCRRITACGNKMTECTAYCEDSERAISGGVSCYSTGGWKTFVADSSPTQDFKGWHGRCIDVEGNMTGLGYVHVVCCSVQ